MKLVWLDVETGGLDPAKHALLSVGVRITDAELNYVGELEADLAWAPDGQSQGGRGVDDFCKTMHEANGLLKRCSDSKLSIAEAETALLVFLRHHLRGDKGYLSGSSVHFDRTFLSFTMPAVLELFHHRHLDVSVFKVAAEAWGMSEPKLGEAAHTPLADIGRSMNALRYWKKIICGPRAG